MYSITFMFVIFTIIYEDVWEMMIGLAVFFGFYSILFTILSTCKESTRYPYRYSNDKLFYLINKNNVKYYCNNCKILYDLFKI